MCLGNGTIFQVTLVGFAGAYSSQKSNQEQETMASRMKFLTEEKYNTVDVIVVEGAFLT